MKEIWETCVECEGEGVVAPRGHRNYYAPCVLCNYGMKRCRPGLVPFDFDAAVERMVQNELKILKPEGLPSAEKALLPELIRMNMARRLRIALWGRMI